VTHTDDDHVSQKVIAEAISAFGADFLDDLNVSALAAADGAVSGVGRVPTGRAVLVVKRGPNAGSRFLLDQLVTSAGRHAGSDIFLDDVTVSRRHAEFRREGGEFKVVDVGSLNGTYVNREPIDSAELTNGDEIHMGKFGLVFLTEPATG
jgi:pSer/pThr/pTyr-binding forkhead associated (FHA) protein